MRKWLAFFILTSGPLAPQADRMEEARLRAESYEQERALIDSFTKKIPACVAAWDGWARKIGVDAQLLDYQDRKRYWEMRRTCESAFKQLDKAYGGKRGKGL